MKFIKDIDIKNKTVILRADFNVTIKDEKVLDNTKIRNTLKTINYILDNNCRLIIFSHLGKVKSEEDKKKNTLYPVYLELKNMVTTNVYFSEFTRGKDLEDKVNKLQPKEILLVENTRYEDFPRKKESSCDDELSKYWASLGEVFINDAFGTTHRKHASNYGIKKYLLSAYGFLINEEKTKLDELLYNSEKPFTVIMGGAKVDDKTLMIKELLKKCDNLIVGGGIANTFLYANGQNVGKSLISNSIDEVKDIIHYNENKIILPKDFVVLNNNDVLTRNINEISENDIIYDIGSNSLNLYKNIIANSKTIFLNGTIGLYEDERFRKGTSTLLKYLSESNAKVFVGGGDAVTSVNELGFNDCFYYKSTGGGATLEYIIKGKLEAIED